MMITVTRRDGSEHVILFDDADADLILARHWSVTTTPRKAHTFYAESRLPVPARGVVRMHRLLLPDARTVDHINHNGLDNRRANLRPASMAQQLANTQPRRGGTSRFKGVSWNSRDRRWRAQIQVGSKNRSLGYFTSEVDAAAAYDAAAIEMFGEYAFTNGVVQ